MNLFIISKSDRPLGLHRTSSAQQKPIVIPTIPLECVQDALDRIIAENRVHQRELGSGKVLAYIQDSAVALNIIEHAMFLHVETLLNFSAFLCEYADVPEECPACREGIDYLDLYERLEHIIACKWKSTQMIIAAAAKVIEPPRTLH